MADGANQTADLHRYYGVVGTWKSSKLHVEQRWLDLVPERIAVEQAGWDRDMKIRRMRSLGFKYKEIGDHFGLSASRIHQMVQTRKVPTIPPVVSWSDLGRAVSLVAGFQSLPNQQPKGRSVVYPSRMMP